MRIARDRATRGGEIRRQGVEKTRADVAATGAPSPAGQPRCRVPGVGTAGGSERTAGTGNEDREACGVARIANRGEAVSVYSRKPAAGAVRGMGRRSEASA